MLTLHKRNLFLANYDQWIVYEYDTCVGTVWAHDQDSAIRRFMSKRSHLGNGLFAVKVP